MRRDFFKKFFLSVLYSTLKQIWTYTEVGIPKLNIHYLNSKFKAD